MKYTVAIVGAFAAFTNANLYDHGHRLHFPRGNTTVTSAAPGDSQTTLTVIATKVHTVISCAPTVTNCPADEKGMSTVPASDRVTQVITNTVVLTKTVCPVSEVAKISSKVISDHEGGKITGSTLPPTGPSSTAAPGGSPDPSQATSQEPTTTVTATRTKTRTVTISKVEETAAASGSGVPGNSAAACNDNPTVTVTVAQTTVTVPASTVFVTVPCDASQTEPAKEPFVTQKPITPQNKGTNDNGGKKPEPSQDTEPCPPDVTSTIEKVVTVVPFPIKNGTNTATSGVAKPSGFAQLRR